MLTDAQITEGGERLGSDGKLTAADQSDLLAIFRMWLGVRSSKYPGMAAALAAAVTPTAERLAGALILLKKIGFNTTDLDGGRLGIKTSKGGKRSLMIEYAFGLLFNLPSKNFSDSGGSTSVMNEVVY